MKKVLCISRRYEPSIGGMATFATAIFSNLEESKKLDVKLLVLRKNKWNFIWFYPYTLLYLLFFSHKYDAIFIGDALLLLCGVITGKVSPKTKRIVAVHGLDITFNNVLYQRILHRFLRNSFDRFVCNSYATELLLKNRGINNTRVIPLGADAERYSKVFRDRDEFCKKYGIASNDIVLLTVGRLVKRKGVLWFLDNVLCRLDNRYVYMIVGDGPDKNAIKHFINEHADRRIVLIDNADDSALNDIYVNSDIFVMPNIHIENDMEGFGLVAVEASLAGNVVIASDVDGISTAVKNGKNGFLVQSLNAVAFEEKIKEVSKSDMSDMRTAVSKYTKEEFDWVLVAERYEKIICEEVESDD